MAPEVSICIPTYNQVKHLKLLLDSIVDQSFTDFEIIVSDDSPGNEVSELLNKYEFGEKLSYFKQSPALGSPANWNFALEKARGQFIKIMHHDDYFSEKDSLFKLVVSLRENSDAAFVFCATKIDLVDKKMTKIHRCSSSQLKKIKLDQQNLFMRNYIGAPSTIMVRKNNFRKFDENLTWLVDVDWYMSLISGKNNFHYINEPLISTTHGAIDQTTQKIQNDRSIQIREHIYLFERSRQTLTKQINSRFIFRFSFINTTSIRWSN